MKFDTSGISLADLSTHLHETYGILIGDLSFTPKGEEAYSYIGVGPQNARFFVRVQRDDANARPEEVYAAVAALRDDCGLTAALAPLRTVRGQFTSQFGPDVIVVFPFISGTTAFETGISGSQWRQTAQIVATLHASGARCVLPILPRENFDNPFAAPIRNALDRITSADLPGSTYQERVIALLRDHQTDVASTLNRMRQLGRAARLRQPEFVPTHGDPNLANVLIGDDGSLHLIDWGELSLGPRERDLTFFTGERFESFLRRYLKETGPVRLHRTLFAFYFYRWVVQEIADFTARILAGSGEPDEQAHAWEELQPYLPVSHESIEIGLNANMRVLAGLSAEGLLGLGH